MRSNLGDMSREAHLSLIEIKQRNSDLLQRLILQMILLWTMAGWRSSSCSWTQAAVKKLKRQ